jgi:hypothetical protein
VKKCTVRKGSKGTKCKNKAIKVVTISGSSAKDYLCNKCFNSFNNSFGYISDGRLITIQDI